MMTSSYINVLQCMIPWKVPSHVSYHKNTHVEGTTNSCSLLLLAIMLEATDIKIYCCYRQHVGLCMCMQL